QRRRRGFLLAAHATQPAEELHREDVEDERDDQEIDDLSDEDTEWDLLAVQGDRPLRIGLVSRSDHGNQRHDYILDERVDDLGERSADDDADRDVDDVALEGEVAEVASE